jgi:hypothetical protein
MPWYAVLCLPILFAAGMSLLDSIEGSFMNFAYGWALSNPVRKVFYNLTITGLSVAVAFVIGTIELGGLIGSRLGLSGPFWSWFENVDFNFLGFVIVAMFAATWGIAVLLAGGSDRGALVAPSGGLTVVLTAGEPGARRHWSSASSRLLLDGGRSAAASLGNYRGPGAPARPPDASRHSGPKPHLQAYCRRGFAGTG